jgi:hypothetical protein
MEFIHHLDRRYKINLEMDKSSISNFKLKVIDQDKCKVYEGMFDTALVVDRPEDFEKLMRMFFEGRFIFIIEKEKKGLKLTFQVIIFSILLKQVNLKLKEKEEEREEKGRLRLLLKFSQNILLFFVFIIKRKF